MPDYSNLFSLKRSIAVWRRRSEENGKSYVLHNNKDDKPKKKGFSFFGSKKKNEK